MISCWEDSGDRHGELSDRVRARQNPEGVIANNLEHEFNHALPFKAG